MRWQCFPKANSTTCRRARLYMSIECSQSKPGDINTSIGTGGAPPSVRTSYRTSTPEAGGMVLAHHARPHLNLLGATPCVARGTRLARRRAAAQPALELRAGGLGGRLLAQALELLLGLRALGQLVAGAGFLELLVDLAGGGAGG